MTESSVAADLFQVMPPLTADEYAELKADIAARGVMVPIEYDESGNILDGHHRVKACQELGIKDWPSVVRLGLDAQAKTLHAIKLNCARRHLTTAGKQTAIQKALTAAPEKSDRQLAKAIGVSDKTVGAVRKELEAGAEIPHLTTTTGADGKAYPRQVERKLQADRPTMAQAVLSALSDEEREAVDFVTADGEIHWKGFLEYDEEAPEPAYIISIPVAKPDQVAKVAAQAQTVIENAAPKTVAKLAANDINLLQAQRELKEQTREARREENRSIIQQATPLSEISARFATIVIDPPWDWGDEGDVDQMGRARPDYATLSYEELLTLPVADKADTDCHLYLWITNRSLPKGFALLDAWGFRYITCLTWIKPSFGMGNYFRGQSEQVLFGVKGSQPLKRKDASTVFHAPRGTGGHSSKPVEFYGFVESCSPSPYLEMFSRTQREGWAVWGQNS